MFRRSSASSSADIVEPDEDDTVLSRTSNTSIDDITHSPTVCEDNFGSSSIKGRSSSSTDRSCPRATEQQLPTQSVKKLSPDG
ncbi:uncharacterized protein LOC135378858 isoform X2 [Ornithodoros turicata]|uniref:uncharacterized protein LOC135378858 isoform X2 n=1 Tax=Ornithodoros turicata TaxID=34597 RepID=UPI0031387284